jgi:16S rRNA (adenine1518-N6/adenine1519-N6)-dimethyltransferase
MPSHVQTQTEIRGILSALGVRPKKRFGQHFLIDGNLMRRLAESAEIEPDDMVLEVGAGTGGLTDLLVAEAGQVVAVEVDRKLAGFLRERFAQTPELRLIECDVLANKNRLAADVVSAIGEAKGTRAMLVSNLPYAVASPLLLNLLCQVPRVTRFCFTVQRDVAERIEAEPHGKDYGPLSVTLQAAATIHRIAHVPPSAFWPRPNVESTMLRLDVQALHLSSPDQIARFASLVREAFAHRRKTLRYNLRRTLDEAGLQSAEELLDLSRRPEELAVDEWLALARRTALSQ